MRRTLALVPLLLAVGAGCGSASSDADDDEGSSTSLGALSESSARPHVFVSPEVTGGAHRWETVVMQNQAGFDGVIVFGRTTRDAEPDLMLTIDRRTGAVSYLASASDAVDANVSKELEEAGNALAAMTSAHTDVGTRGLVTPDNACFIKVASIAVLAVGAVIAAPFVIEAATVAVADAATGVAEHGLRGFAMQVGKASLKNPKVQKLIAFKIAKEGLKGWLLFSDRGKMLTAPLRKQVSIVVHAKCTPPDTGETITFAGP